MAAVILVATITPLPEHRDAVIAAFEQVIPAVHEEPGCELYALHEMPDHLVIIEKWADEDALAVHYKAPALAALGPALAGKIDGPTDLKVMAARPLGHADLGAL